MVLCIFSSLNVLCVHGAILVQVLQAPPLRDGASRRPEARRRRRHGGLRAGKEDAAPRRRGRTRARNDPRRRGRTGRGTYVKINCKIK